jgi:hypothetical protein
MRVPLQHPHGFVAADGCNILIRKTSAVRELAVASRFRVLCALAALRHSDRAQSTLSRTTAFLTLCGFFLPRLPRPFPAAAPQSIESLGFGEFIPSHWGISLSHPIQNVDCFRDIGETHTLAEKRFRPDRRELFRHCHVDELIQGDALLVRSSARFIQERRLKSQGKVAFSHLSSLIRFKASRGVTTLIPKSDAVGSKSLRL